ncbi:RagB/SusD family nutrient uptake outer membrane protein [Proteiniphilum sp.]|uniref:RagB/SusD family nutrient uptake outer membrane protein n=1 Tax=Proteiniphilum sp. TaxID=1926877 RepID=UPI00332D25B9
MEKKYIIYLFSLFFVACADLDIQPDGRITLSDVFKEEIKTEAFLGTVYTFRPAYFWYYTNQSMLAGSSDEAEDSMVGSGAPNINARWIAGGLTPSYNPGIDLYSQMWRGVQYANIFLENIHLIEFEDRKKQERLIGEAKILRAYYYWELVKQYGPMPIFEKAPDVNFEYASLTRPTFQDNIDFIVKDCDDAIANTNIPLRIFYGAEAGRMTRAVAYAIKSQALLYNASPLWNPDNQKEKWSNAAIAARQAIEKLTADDVYKLVDNYGKYFLLGMDYQDNPTDTETILESSGAGALFIANHSIPSRPGSSKAGVCPTQELVDAYDMQETGEPAILGYQDKEHLIPIINEESGYDPANPYEGRDPRFYETVWYNGAIYDNINGNIHIVETFIGGSDQLLKVPPYTKNTHTGYYLRKYIDPRIQGTQTSTATWKKYRLAELYLNLAEAENEANGPIGGVYNAINEIRKRAGMKELPPNLTQEEMRSRIRNERRVELAFEEHRFWDVRRWKILDKTDRNVTGMEIMKDNDNALFYKRFSLGERNAWQEKFLIFPLPIGDVSNIPNFSEQQNPGW